jgi:hypothetical protein
MPHAPFLNLYWVISCHPSPCEQNYLHPNLRLSLSIQGSRTTTAAPLPCRIFRLYSHSHFWRSGLGNPRLGLLDVACCDVGWGFRPFPLIAAGRHEYCATRVIHFPCRRNARLYNHPSPLALSYATLDCPSSSLAFILIHNFSSHRSVVGRWFPQLTISPICYTPRQVSHQDKLGDDSVAHLRRLYFSTAALPKAESYINPRDS